MTCWNNFAKLPINKSSNIFNLIAFTRLFLGACKIKVGLFFKFVRFLSEETISEPTLIKKET